MFYLSTNLTHGAGDGSTESYITLPIAAKLNSIRLCPDTAVTANNTNFVTVTIADNAAATIFSQTTQVSGGGSLTAGTPITVPPSTSADLDFAAGETIKLRVADTAAGVNCAFTVVYEFKPARSF